MRYLTALCILALAVAIALPAYAETQNVKVSGKIIERWINQYDYDLNKGDVEGYPVVDPAFPNELGLFQTEKNANFWMSTAWVQVDADMTDNVSTTIRLLNQRDWNDEAFGAGNANAFDVGVTTSYVTLKEMLYSPLTVKIGRQPLWFGRGFIIGKKLRDPEGSIGAPEFTEYTNFDAVRATLDYDPWTIDAIYSKIEENANQAHDDIDLYGINVGYLFDSYNAEAEGYWFYKNDQNNTVLKANRVHTVGARFSMDPVTNLTVAAEGAAQLGRYVDPANGFEYTNRPRSAFAADIMAEYRFADMTWKPTLMGEYIFYSGSHYGDNTGAFHSWDPMYRGKFDTAIREFQGWMYLNDAFPAGEDASTSNQHQLAIGGTLKPTDTLKIEGKYTNFQLAKPIMDAAGTIYTNKHVGDEVDVNLTYDYTEDVQFGLLMGWFIPGNLYPENLGDIATEIVATCAVDF